MGMRINMNVARFKEQLQATTNELQKATRPAAQAGAQIIYDAARLNAPVSKRPHKFYGTHKVYGPYAPGNLRDS
ncbi:MAG TPA: HK97 gp10 family phage protein, partial [Aquabacterium sp.]|nr:HK97 gp10 family phage protein [Aquabacterium sp.]